MFLGLLIACAKQVPAPPPRTVTVEAGLRAELATTGSLNDRLANADEADLIIFYAGEQRGDLAPCGCPSRPRGGLPRAASYINAADKGLFLNAGGWLDGGQGLDGNPIPEASLKNQWMFRGLQQMNVSAVSVGFDDLLGLSTLAESPPSLPMVSANLTGPGIQTHVLVEHRGLTIGISGLSHTGHLSLTTPGYTRTPPNETVDGVLEQLGKDSDVVVIFSHGATAAAKRIARKGLVDVVIDTDAHRSFDPPFRVGETIWVRSHIQGQRLGELRLGIVDKQITWALDRKIDMDDLLPDHPEQKQLSDTARAELEVLKTRLFGP
jgi:2',3'-cyclic-nucleotide 2'-phosphodiesterase (5'-nucleotidase family)